LGLNGSKSLKLQNGGLNFTIEANLLFPNTLLRITSTIHHGISPFGHTQVLEFNKNIRLCDKPFQIPIVMIGII